MLIAWDDDIIKLRDKVMAALNNLFTYNLVEHKVTITKHIVESARDCHLRPERTSKNTKRNCPICMADSYLEEYERKLFKMEWKYDANKGSWRQSTEESALKGI